MRDFGLAELATRSGVRGALRRGAGCGATTSIGGRFWTLVSSSCAAIPAPVQSTRLVDTEAIISFRAPIFLPFYSQASAVLNSPFAWTSVVGHYERTSHKRSGIIDVRFPGEVGNYSRLCLARSSNRRRNQRLHRDTALAGGHAKRTAQRQNALAHADQTEAELLARLHAAPVVADPHPGADPTVTARLPGRLDNDIDRGRAGVAKHIGQRLLHDAVDG